MRLFRWIKKWLRNPPRMTINGWENMGCIWINRNPITTRPSVKIQGLGIINREKK